MIPLELSIEGMHSYKDRVTIPFADLVGEGFFGIFGPTGSGKSTILDALTLALYGRVDRFMGGGGSRITPVMNLDADEMRVAFTFQLGDTSYRATRRFVRVDEEKVQQREAELVDLDAGVALASQAREVRSTVEQMLGMDFDQFTRAVFLPQGKFAQFLDDQPSDRIELLEDLFGLGRFGDALRARVRDHRREVREEHTNLEGQLESLQAYDEQTLEDIETELAEATEEVQALEERKAELEPRVQQARELTEHLATLDEKTKAREALESNEPEIDRMREELDRARQAATPKQVWSELTSQREVRCELSEEVEELELRIEAADDALEAFEHDRAEREQGLRARRDELVPLRETIDALRDERERIERLHTEHAELEEKLEALPAKPEHEPPARLTLDRARALVQHATEGIQIARNLVQRQRDADEAEAELERLEAQRGKLAERITSLSQTLEERTEHVSELEDAKHTLQVEHQAAALLEALEEDAPCPVCGSPEHPAPVEPPEDDPRELAERLEQAKVARQEAFEKLTAARERDEALAEQRERSQEALERRHEQRTEASEAEAAHRADLALDGLEDEAWENIQARGQAWVQALELERLTERRKDVRDQLSTYEERWTKVRAGLEIEAGQPRPSALDAASKRLDERVAGIDAELAAIEKRERSMREDLDELRRKHAGQAERLESIRERIETIQDRFDQALAKTRLDSAEEVEQAFREPERIEALEEAVSDHEQALRDLSRDIQALEARIEAIELTSDEAKHVRAAWEGLEDDLTQAREGRAKLSERLEHHQEQLAKRTRLLERYGEVDTKLGRLDKLHGLLSGRGFVEYLARARFDGVLLQASRRLAQISGGQYHLEGNPREIRVVDHLAGASTRDLRTLSGGERFMVSLSLALALSDAIQNERGGGYPPIEFFFLDEGFGSLDTETLAAVMHLLQDLAQQGIHVGMITHVERAKRYVPSKLVVEKPTEQHGSQVQVIE